MSQTPSFYALFEAIKTQDNEALEALLKAGTSVAVTDDRHESGGFTPLQLAASVGHLPAVKVLLQYGADPAFVNRHGETALYLAALDRHEAIVELLSSLVSDEDRLRDLDLAAQDRRSREISESDKSQRRQVFFSALIQGDIEQAESLISTIDVNDAESFGRLPLMAILDLGLEKLTSALLEAGANPDLWQDQGPHRPSTPLGMAIATQARKANRRRLTELLLSYGADPNGRGLNGDTPLHEAALFSAGGKGHLGGLEVLLKAGSDLEAKNAFGQTPWMLAALQEGWESGMLPPKRRRAAVRKALEKKGADTSHRPSVDLILAAEKGDEPRALAALTAGADPRSKTVTGSSALFLAVRARAVELVRALLERGADPARPDPLHGGGTTPLELAKKEGFEEIEGLLRSARTAEH